MNSEFNSVLVLLHVIAMAVWFAGTLLTAGDVASSLAQGGAHLKPMVKRGNTAERLSTIAGMLTVVTGFALVFSGGGFDAMPMRIHLGLALTILIFFFSALFTKTTWRRIVGIIEREGNIEEARALAKRFSVFTGIEHLLRTIIIILMVVRF